MTKKFLKNTLAFLMLCGFGLFITSCSEEADAIVDVETTENFVDQAVFSLQTEGNIGKMGCFEFVFPISIVYPDATEESVDDYETLRASLRAWFEENAESLDLPERDSSRRFRHGYWADIPWDQIPTLAFPVEVTTEDGEVITVNDRVELLALKKRCRRSFYGERGRHGHRRGDKCFSLVFPVTIVLPDDTSFDAGDRADLKSQLREWKAANPDAEERPMLQFPVTVQLEDESTVEVVSSEELQELKETCSAD